MDHTPAINGVVDFNDPEFYATDDSKGTPPFHFEDVNHD